MVRSRRGSLGRACSSLRWRESASTHPCWARPTRSSPGRTMEQDASIALDSQLQFSEENRLGSILRRRYPLSHLWILRTMSSGCGHTVVKKPEIEIPVGISLCAIPRRDPDGHSFVHQVLISDGGSATRCSINLVIQLLSKLSVATLSVLPAHSDRPIGVV